MSTVWLKCRDYDEGESFPYIEVDGTDNNHFHPCDETIYHGVCAEELGLSEDAWDDEEFNEGIYLNGRIVRVRSIHFDFIIQRGLEDGIQ